MRISGIIANFGVGTKNSAKNRVLFNKELNKNTYAFKGDSFNKKTDSVANESATSEKYINMLPKEFLSTIKTKTPLGVGANSSVYAIPDNDDYVLKILDKKDPNGIVPGMFPDDINVGQPVWVNPDNPKMMILKKVKGEEHSIPSWSRTIYNPKTIMPDYVTKKQAEIYFDKVDKLAKMSDDSYLDFAKKVKEIDSKKCKIDSINPNNLIVSENEIGIIDFFKVRPDEQKTYQNSSYDMLAIMLDFTLFPEYYDKLNNENKKRLIEDVKIIKDKVEKVSEETGIDCNEENFKTYVKAVARWFPAHSVWENNKPYFRYYDVRLCDFIDMINNPDEWAGKRD